MSLFTRWADALDALKAQGRYRSLRPPEGIDFTSNDYLGYGGRGEPEDWSGGLRRSGGSLPRSGMASRLLRGSHPIWEEVEAQLARWHGAEAALVMTSGYAANEGLLSTVIKRDDWAASDERNHASIIDGLRLARCLRYVYRHNDLDHLEAGLKEEAARAVPGRARFVVTESLFSMDGDRAPLKGLADLAVRYGAHVIVDEAHATGCFGPEGAGCADADGVRGRVLASVHTGGKALALPGAYIVGSGLLKDYLVNHCRHLIYTTALPPACGGWWREGLARARTDDAGRHRLHAAAALFRKELEKGGIPALGGHYIVPVVLGDDARAVAVAARLRESGYDVSAIRPPTVRPGTARLRLSVHADHTAEALAGLAGELAVAMEGPAAPRPPRHG